MALVVQWNNKCTAIRQGCWGSQQNSYEEKAYRGPGLTAVQTWWEQCKEWMEHFKGQSVPGVHLTLETGASCCYKCYPSNLHSKIHLANRNHTILKLGQQNHHRSMISNPVHTTTNHHVMSHNFIELALTCKTFSFLALTFALLFPLGSSLGFHQHLCQDNSHQYGLNHCTWNSESY